MIINIFPLQPITVTEAYDTNTSFKATGGGVQCKAEDLSKRLYGDICGKVASSSLLPCILDLCRALWSIMDSYKVTLEGFAYLSIATRNNLGKTAHSTIYIYYLFIFFYV